jgi:hypothetical protein
MSAMISNVATPTSAIGFQEGAALSGMAGCPLSGGVISDEDSDDVDDGVADSFSITGRVSPRESPVIVVIGLVLAVGSAGAASRSFLIGFWAVSSRFGVVMGPIIPQDGDR